jgi:hypothetical protein
LKKFVFACILLSLTNATALAQTITVTSPNGGENWALGSTQAITWTSSGVTGNVRILLFKGAASVGIIRDNVPVTAGSYDWAVGTYQGGTAVPGTDYKVRIRKMQTEILDASNREFTISPAVVTPPPVTPPPSGSITVSNPNGGETWLLKVLGVNSATVAWTSSNVSGTVTLILKKAGSAVRSQTFTNTGSALFSFAGMAEGADYRMRVENADNSVSDESDRNFSIRKETLTPRVRDPASLALAVRDFKLNNGAETTDSPIVTMNHTALGVPTYYRWRTEARQDMSPWVRYVDSEPKANLPETFGEHTIYFQVKNNTGESSPVSDSIRYFAEKEYEWGPGVLNVCPCRFTYSGWKKWSVIERAFPGDLSPDPTEVTCEDGRAGNCYWGIKIEVKEAGYMMVRYGAKSEFEFFAGRLLNEGWSFVRLEYEGQEGEGKGYRITRMPQPGSRDITFRVRVWVDEGHGTCIFRIKKIIVKGPADMPVSAAFK